jgi:hypothetical protein
VTELSPENDDSRFYVRNSDPQTSHEAAELLNVGSIWIRLLRFLVQNDRDQGWANFEIADSLPDELGVCPWHRVGDLRKKGWADWIYREDGSVLTRYNQETERHQGVSRVTEEGRDHLRQWEAER